MELPNKLQQANAKRNHVGLRHVVESQQFTVPLLMELFDRSRLMERVVARGGTLDYQDKILASLFYKPSTRTRFCFEAAMPRLGGRVLSTEHAQAFSSELRPTRIGGFAGKQSGWGQLLSLRVSSTAHSHYA